VQPRVLVHRRDFVLGSREVNAPTTPAMKYRHYAPGVPVTLLYTTKEPPPEEVDDNGDGGAMRRVALRCHAGDWNTANSCIRQVAYATCERCVTLLLHLALCLCAIL